MTYSIDIINLFINNYINGITLSKISENTNISIQTLRRQINLYRNNIINKLPLKDKDLFKNKNIHRLNKRYKFKNDIINYVNKNEGCLLDDIYKNINKVISKPSICRILKENNITRKRCNIRVVCRDIDKINELRVEFSKTVNEDTFLDSEFIDETSFCIDDIFNYGYSKKGKEILKITKHSRNKERFTLLSSISKNTIRYRILEGSVNSEIYLKFISDNKEDFKNTNIVQDNTRIHHSKIVKNYCLENNIKMIYNPPYTLEFNPIELIFNKIKTEYKKLDHKNIKDDITKCLKKITDKDFKNCMIHSLKIINTYK